MGGIDRGAASISGPDGDGAGPDAMRLISYLTPGFPASLFVRIADTLGAELVLEEHASGPLPGEDPFRDGEADLGWICTTSYVDLGMFSATPTVGLAGVAWVPDDPDSEDRPVYFGDLLVGVDSSISSLDDLAGKRIGCNDPVSLSGYYALKIELRQRGRDPDRFAHLVLTGSHNRSLDLVAAGELDAAVVDSVVRLGRIQRDPEIGALRLIDRLGPWPTQPVVVRRTLDPHQLDEARAAMLALNDDPVFADELARAGLRRLVEVGPDHCDSVAAAMRLLQ